MPTRLFTLSTLVDRSKPHTSRSLVGLFIQQGLGISSPHFLAGTHPTHLFKQSKLVSATVPLLFSRISAHRYLDTKEKMRDSATKLCEACVKIDPRKIVRLDLKKLGKSLEKGILIAKLGSRVSSPPTNGCDLCMFFYQNRYEEEDYEEEQTSSEFDEEYRGRY
ncbi:uncharacterized protein LY89DRAFT_719810 [Mollisia scopiformis]|uniref:Uncharacterized protein n=1 Tax=Mollisia scopiformis TaxID=149040 RepID=A0A194X4U8_MOLSC|nr:uncharacterized protein LY89DRAFT_719810 [Mollisia scopiformis]KUJ15201.1 hypothetical protein LY89DRAFT_719810 [Mollisia scopiformis]